MPPLNPDYVILGGGPAGLAHGLEYGEIGGGEGGLRPRIPATPHMGDD